MNNVLTKETIYLAGKVNDSIVDGDGFRYTIFVQGCPHKCEGCHNPHTHNFGGGSLENIEDIYNEIVKNPLLDGVTFSGGEPFCQALPLAQLASLVHGHGLNVITYTGYDFEYLYDNANENNHYMDLINASDFIIDGKFIKQLKSYKYNFVGSGNQRIIDCNKSNFKAKKLVLRDITQ